MRGARPPRVLRAAPRTPGWPRNRQDNSQAMPRVVRPDEPVTATLSELPVEIDLGGDVIAVTAFFDGACVHVVMGAWA